MTLWRCDIVTDISTVIFLITYSVGFHKPYSDMDRERNEMERMEKSADLVLIFRQIPSCKDKSFREVCWLQYHRQGEEEQFNHLCLIMLITWDDIAGLYHMGRFKGITIFMNQMHKTINNPSLVSFPIALLHEYITLLYIECYTIHAECYHHSVIKIVMETATRCLR